MNTKKISKCVFYIALTIELLMLIIDKSAFTNPYEGRLFQITFLLFVCKIAMTEYTGREWLVMAAFIGLGAISYVVTGRNEVIRITALIAACKDMNIKEIFTYMFRIILVGCLVLVILSLAGVLGDVKLTEVFRGDEAETRYCLGLGHPNALHCMYFMLTLLWMYLKAQQIRVYHFGVIMAGNIGLFLLTDSKTGAMAVTFAVLCAAAMKYVKKFQNSGWFYGLVTLELTGCVGIAWLAAKYSEWVPYYAFLKKLDKLLSSRIVNLYYNSAIHAGTLDTWTWWGTVENEYYFDMGWVRLFYWYGIIPAGIYILLLTALIWQMKKNKDYMGVVVMSSLFMYTLVEAHIISVYMARDYILFFLGAYWTRIFHGNQGEPVFFWQVPRLIFKKGVTDK